MNGLIPFIVLNVTNGFLRHAKTKNVFTVKIDLNTQGLKMDNNDLYHSAFSHPFFTGGAVKRIRLLELFKALEAKEQSEKEEQMAKPDENEYYEGQYGTSTIDIIEEFELGFSLGNVVKYVLRAGKKDGNSEFDDLKKAHWYLGRYVDSLRDD